MEIDLKQLLREKPIMKTYSFYLEKKIVESIKKTTKVSFSRIMNDLLKEFEKRLNATEEVQER